MIGSFIKYRRLCGDFATGGLFKERYLVDQLGKLLDSYPVVLRESDKKMGWSLNKVEWYQDEYNCQLGTSSYKLVGNLDIVESLKLGCRKDLKSIVSKHKVMLSDFDFDLFNLEARREYVLPSLNLLPKVHKLPEEASMGNENLLRGRPIITGHSWCIVEASKFIQRELRKVINRFEEFLGKKGVRGTLLGSSGELVNILRDKGFQLGS